MTRLVFPARGILGVFRSACVTHFNRAYSVPAVWNALQMSGQSLCHRQIYQHKSNLEIAPGVQIRFLMDKGYDKLLVQTEPWKSG